MDKKVMTLTIEDAMDLIRSYGISISYKKLIAWTDINAVPWAVSGPDETGKYQRTIFKKPLMEWLDNLAEEV